ncbi:MAG: polysaccharide biosynthesis C-terminal domain-containing protein, partial [Erysipelotrichaceae bacterium]|nr:polysaccharide biosynthesis C-terminal domain-containing protein [Erysipelotrichaceae bacterium]
LGIGAAVNVVLNALWIPLFGIAGASFATLVTQVVTSMIAPLLFTRTRENTLFILKGMNPAVFFRVISSLIAGRRQNG